MPNLLVTYGSRCMALGENFKAKAWKRNLWEVIVFIRQPLPLQSTNVLSSKSTDCGNGRDNRWGQIHSATIFVVWMFVNPQKKIRSKVGPNHDSTIAVQVVMRKHTFKHPNIPLSKVFCRLHLHWESFSQLNAARYTHHIQVSRIPLLYKLIYATVHIVGVFFKERAWHVKMFSNLGKLQLRRGARSHVVSLDC